AVGGADRETRDCRNRDRCDPLSVPLRFERSMKIRPRKKRPTSPGVPTVQTRMDLINLLIRNRGYRGYLEIGCFADQCFREIAVEHKVGVDPCSGGTVRMTSDAYFAEAIERRERFD